MPELRDIPVLRWGEELRRHRSARSRGRRSHFVTAMAAAACTALIATLLWPPGPALLWNATQSSPVGLYAVTAADGIERDDMVVAWPPASARALAAERGYLPINVPLVKRVAAAEGDRVCAAGEALYVNGALAASRRARDGIGRPLPRWNGCLELGPGQYLLLMADSPASFDGRYFGVTEALDLVGEARLLWAS